MNFLVPWLFYISVTKPAATLQIKIRNFFLEVSETKLKKGKKIV